MMSSCLFGKDVMFWGGNFQNEFMKVICNHPEVKIVHFCPEHFVLGTPRNNMLIHGGDGNSVWSNEGKVIDTNGKDLTEVMKTGAFKMLEMAKNEKPNLIILTEGSDSCGSQVILDPENEVEGKNALKPGQGLAASLLMKNGFQIMSHKNEKEIYDFLRTEIEMPITEGLNNFEL
jgi:uncharacterized protein YbbK (DUF523 family)